MISLMISPTKKKKIKREKAPPTPKVPPAPKVPPPPKVPTAPKALTPLKHIKTKGKNTIKPVK